MSGDDAASEREKRSHDRSGSGRQSLESERKRAATVGTALLITAVIAGTSNIGLAMIAGAIQRTRPRAEPPPSWVRPEDRASWERGRVAAPGFQLCCAGVVSLGIYLPVFLGGLRLQQGGGWGLGLTAAIMALLPCSPGFLLGLPVGIWALIVLSDSNVQEALRSRSWQRRRRPLVEDEGDWDRQRGRPGREDC